MSQNLIQIEESEILFKILFVKITMSIYLSQFILSPEQSEQSK